MSQTQILLWCIALIVLELNHLVAQMSRPAE
jgi:hypothetical protein